MLLVPVYIDKSAIHGLGVFAAQAIAQGTPIWRFTPDFDLELDPALVERQPAHFRERLLHYGYIDPRLGRYILCCDEARFINHSDSPNLQSDFSLERHGLDIAVIDVRAGEELTLDYAYVEGQRPQPPSGMRES